MPDDSDKPEPWFVGWVKHHCEATGADATTARVLLASRHTIVGSWAATAGELGEVTARLVATRRVPQFPAQHTNAIYDALTELRAERLALPPAPAAATGFACDACEDTGVASVPHPLCVRDRRVVLLPRVGLVTGTALCDRPGCAAGARARQSDANRAAKPGAGPRQARLGDLEAELEVGDLAAMLRRAESERAAACRRTADGPNPFAGVFARLRQRIRDAADGTGPESQQDAA